jgi:hypothetical protein
VPYNGGNYSFLVNFTTKGIAIVAAAVASLDAIITVPTPPFQQNTANPCLFV